MDKKTLEELAKYSGEPWTANNRYFVDAEKAIDSLWEKLIFPFIQECDFTAVVDLACGHGRNTAKLLPLSGKVLLMDIQSENVERARRRFGGYGPKVDFLVGNGFDLSPIADDSITLIYCFDAMVHFDSDVVRSYLRDAKRVLQVGGRGFFHHSNYVGGHDWRKNPRSRNFMSRELFEHYAVKEGLQVLAQKIISWGDATNLDCLSLITRDR